MFILYFVYHFNNNNNNIYSPVYQCSVDHAKRPFFRAANGIFAEVSRLASEEVILELLECKCLPVLLYGDVVHWINGHWVLLSLDFHSIDFFNEIV